MRKLKIIEHISLDGVIQVSGEDEDFPTVTGPRPIGPPLAEMQSSLRRARASTCCLAVAPTIFGRASAEGAEQSDGGRSQCGNKICRYPPSGKPSFGNFGRTLPAGSKRVSFDPRGKANNCAY